MEWSSEWFLLERGQCTTASWVTLHIDPFSATINVRLYTDKKGNCYLNLRFLLVHSIFVLAPPPMGIYHNHVTWSNMMWEQYLGHGEPDQNAFPRVLPGIPICVRVLLCHNICLSVCDRHLKSKGSPEKPTWAPSGYMMCTVSLRFMVTVFHIETLRIKNDLPWQYHGHRWQEIVWYI